MDRTQQTTRGAFISVEGGDGAGKTTQLKFIQDVLRAQNRCVLTTREPGGTALGDALRDLLLQGDVNISTHAELLLLFTARMQHIDAVIRPALARGVWVVCDRFTDSTYAYQGGGQGIATDRIAVLENWVQGSLRPDLTLVLDLPPQLGEARARGKCTDADRFERQARPFKEAVRAAYRDIAAQAPHRVKLVDASQDISRVQQAIVAVLNDFYPRFTAAQC